ncbi:MAG: hypothetical protein KVP17_000314 [Porospora cf. gigantea B]|uniref:uncharacterized protein n=1 Tax=Porospora cf. gigantea B TaxID=2853592 RepID=UPI00357180C8|nr:MAG: hypothetical protein KVP17_000314 [Porospora cf. gigantea B]
MIRKEAYVGPAVLDELYRLVEETEIAKEDDQDWPVPDPSGQQELEIIMDDKHLKFTTCKLGALSEVNDCKDQEGLRVFYYLVQDLKCLVLSLISLHFRVSCPLPVLCRSNPYRMHVMSYDCQVLMSLQFRSPHD